MTINLRVLASTDCRNGDCPTLRIDDATGDMYVQGYLPLAGVVQVPDGEGTVRIPGADWAQLLAQLEQ